MEKMYKNDMMKVYVSPSVVEVEISNEGVLCQSGGGTETLGDDIYGEWSK